MSRPVDFQLLPLDRFESSQIQLKSQTDAILKFLSDSYLVPKTDEVCVVSTAGKDPPNPLAIFLTKTLRAKGYRVEPTKPEKRLHRNEQQTQQEPSPVFPLPNACQISSRIRMRLEIEEQLRRADIGMQETQSTF